MAERQPRGGRNGGAARGGGALPVMSGQVRFETRSLPESLAWIGRDVPLAPLAGAFSVDGRFETAERSVSWPSLRIGLGQNVLEGAGAVALGPGKAPRLSVQATLAAETLDLTPLVADLSRLLDPAPVSIALAPFTRGDLDLRLSAAEGRAGAVRVQDLAASVLVREAALEVAVNRARIQDGTFKGRVNLTSGADPAATELRTQGASIASISARSSARSARRGGSSGPCRGISPSTPGPAIRPGCWRI